MNLHNETILASLFDAASKQYEISKGHFGVPMTDIDHEGLSNTLRLLVEQFGNRNHFYRAWQWNGGKALSFWVPTEIDRFEGGVSGYYVAAGASLTEKKIPYITLFLEKVPHSVLYNEEHGSSPSWTDSTPPDLMDGGTKVKVPVVPGRY